MSMQRHLKHVEGLVTALGIAGATVGRCKKHVVVEIEGPNGSRKVFTSCTPSDHRSLLNFKMEMRRTAREIGALAA